MEFSFDQLAFAYGKPGLQARMRERVEDFRVDEQLGFPLAGSGQHVWLRVRKRNTNTDWLARQLAAAADIPVRDVGYAGLKDRYADTSQWFSVDLRGQPEPDWARLENTDIRFLEVTRHERKLRRGAHAANRFEIVLRDFHGEDADLERRLQRIAVQGVPNYFGQQRFGNQLANLSAALELFTGESKRKPTRQRRSLYLSAARSWLFNAYLSDRINQQNWRTAQPGDVLLLKGSKSFFHCPVVDDEINRRIEAGDIMPSGPLWGTGELPTSAAVEQAEQEIAQRYEVFCRGLVSYGLQQQRRSLVLMPDELHWERSVENCLTLTFSLPAGGFATSVIREIANVD